MKLLFDQGTPVPLRAYLLTHVVDTLAEKGWSEKDHGELLDLAAQEGYEVLVTTDQNLRVINRIWSIGTAVLSFCLLPIGQKSDFMYEEWLTRLCQYALVKSLRCRFRPQAEINGKLMD